MKHLVFIFCLFLSAYSIAQSENASAPADTVLSKQKQGNYATEVFFLANWSVTDRVLTENKGLFGDTLGVRADETSLNKWSFGLGFRNMITKSFAWEGGISLLRNGESYSFSGADTAYNYTTTYTYIAMPLKIDYVFGKKLQLVTAAGIIPQMFMRYRQVGTDVDSKGSESPFDNSTHSGYSPFVLSAVFNVGAQLKLSNQVKFFFIPEYRLQLNSTYTNKSPYIHKANAIGFNIGLSIGM